VTTTKTVNTFQTRHCLSPCKFVTCGVLKRRLKYSLKHPRHVKTAMLRSMEGSFGVANRQRRKLLR